ncbi:MAG TPA: trypsin-like peptidase domain-containing protein, partial [Candidatus Saccharimonadales bacterium]|nr:trypsin-like peptidase domain-containing protein [Candidatus Saccharimonadales bacterium]
MDPNPSPPPKDSLPPVVRASSANNKRPVAQAAARPRAPRIVAIILLSALAGLVAGFGGAALFSLTQGDSQLASPLTNDNDGNKIITQEEENIANVVAKVSPSVVSIVTQSQAPNFYYGTSTAEGAGTGFIVSQNGHIMTNKHVIKDVDTVSVVLADGTTYNDVQVLGTDPLNDIAFLKIPDVDNLPVAELGNSTSIRVGQKVVAIGNSLGQYQNTVTSGIISGTGRPVVAQAGDSVETLTDLIQTDAAINPGNSGGPLLNLQGQVIGINTAIVADAQGIGFAIPIGATKGILKSVLAGEGVERSYLGINYIPITADVAERFDLGVKKGAYVYNGPDDDAVVTDSPADKAGIEEQDIIVKVGDIEVGTNGSVSTLIGAYAPGDNVQLTV